MMTHIVSAIHGNNESEQENGPKEGKRFGQGGKQRAYSGCGPGMFRQSAACTDCRYVRDRAYQRSQDGTAQRDIEMTAPESPY